MIIRKPSEYRSMSINFVAHSYDGTILTVPSSRGKMINV